MTFSGNFLEDDVVFLLKPVQLAPTDVDEKSLFERIKENYRGQHWSRAIPSATVSQYHSIGRPSNEPPTHCLSK